MIEFDNKATSSEAQTSAPRQRPENEIDQVEKSHLRGAGKSPLRDGSYTDRTARRADLTRWLQKHIGWHISLQAA